MKIIKKMVMNKKAKSILFASVSLVLISLFIIYFVLASVTTDFTNTGAGTITIGPSYANILVMNVVLPDGTNGGAEDASLKAGSATSWGGDTLTAIPALGTVTGVGYKEDGSGGFQGTEAVVSDLDKDGVYTSAADTIKIDGADTPSAGDILNDVVAGDKVCSNNIDLDSATCVYVAVTDCNVTNGVVAYYMGAACGTETDTLIATGDNWATTDDVIDATTDFIKENVAEELTYSNSADTDVYTTGGLSAGNSLTNFNATDKHTGADPIDATKSIYSDDTSSGTLNKKADQLNSISFDNALDAVASTDISTVKVWEDTDDDGNFESGSDTNLGTAAWDGDTNKWILSGLTMAIPAGGQRIFAAVDISASPTNNVQIRMRIAQNRLVVASTNDGPTNGNLFNPSTQTIDNAAPYFVTIPANTNINYAQSWAGVDFDATDTTGFSAYAINWTTLFTINQSGYLTSSAALSAGVYNINVTINDSVNNLNSTIYQLTVNQISPSTLMAITGTASISYPQTSDFVSAETNTGDGDCVYATNKTNIVYATGDWLFNYSTAGCENYTAGSVTKTLTVTQNNTLVLGLTPTSSINYLVTTNFAAQESGCPTPELTCSLNITDDAFGGGVVWANYSTPGNENYSAKSAVASVTINPIASQTSLTFNETTPQIYGTAVIPTCAILTGGTEALGLTNGTSGVAETLAAGTWNFNCSYAGNNNYTASSNFSTFGITRANPTSGLNITGTTPIVYETMSDVASSENNTGDGDCAYTQTPNAVYAAGTRTFNYSTAGCENYTAGSKTLDVTITKNSTYVLAINGTTPIVYGTRTNVSEHESGCPVQLLAQSLCTLNLPDDIYAVGAPTFIYATVGNENYSAGSTSQVITINKADPSAGMNISGTTPISYPQVSGFSASENNTEDYGCVYTLTSNAVYGVGTHVFNYSTEGCNNYLSGSVTRTLTVTQNNTLVLGISGTTPITYGTATNVAGSACPSELTCALSPTNGTYGAGTVTFNYSTPGNQNYSAGSIIQAITINPATSTLTLLINGTAGNQTAIYGVGTNVSVALGNAEQSFILYQNNVNINAQNNVLRTLVATDYNFTAIAPATQNYTALTVTRWSHIAKATPTLTFKANGGTSNLTLESPQQVNMSATANYGTVGLDRDGVNYLVNNSLNVTLSLGSYIFRANITGNENYTNVGYSSYNITIRDTTLPLIAFGVGTLSTGVNKSQASIYANVSASDVNEANITFSLSNTTSVVNSTTFAAGTRKINWTAPRDGVYTYNVTVTDLANNRNSTETRTIILDTLAPAINLSQAYQGTTSINVSVTIDTTGSGVNGTCTTSRGTITGTGSSQNIAETGLTCETSYAYNVSCYDYAGNFNSTTVSYSTDTCPGSSGGGGGLSASDTQIGAGYTASFYSGGVLVFNLGGERHRMIVVKIIDGTSVELQFLSTSMTVTMDAGEEKKLDLNADNSYDLLVKVVNLTTNKATISLKEIDEEISGSTEITIPDEGETTNQTETTPGIGETTEETVKSTTSKIRWIIIAVIIIIILAIILYLVYGRDKKKEKILVFHNKK